MRNITIRKMTGLFFSFLAIPVLLLDPATRIARYKGRINTIPDPTLSLLTQTVCQMLLPAQSLDGAPGGLIVDDATINGAMATCTIKEKFLIA